MWARGFRELNQAVGIRPRSLNFCSLLLFAFIFLLFFIDCNFFDTGPAPGVQVGLFWRTCREFIGHQKSIGHQKCLPFKLVRSYLRRCVLHARICIRRGNSIKNVQGKVQRSANHAEISALQRMASTSSGMEYATPIENVRVIVRYS